MSNTPRGSDPLLSCALHLTGASGLGPGASNTILPLRAFAPERLTAVSETRTIALLGKGELLREQSHLCLHCCFRWGLPRHGYTTFARMSFCSRLRRSVTLPFRCPISSSTGGRTLMSPQWQTVSAEHHHVILMEHFKAHTEASKCGWKMSLYGNKRPFGVGSRHNVTLHRHSPFSMAQAVHDLCIASRRLLWTGRWKGLWTAWPHRFFSRPIFDLINNHLKRIKGRYPQCCTPILCVTSACFSSTPINCTPVGKKNRSPSCCQRVGAGMRASPCVCSK